MSYIVGAARSAIAKGKPDGILSAAFHPVDLLSKVLEGAVSQSGVPKASVDDVICGCVTPIGKQGANVGRLASLKAGFPIEVPGVQLNRMCGSGQQAINFASAGVAAGDYDVAIGCGVEMMGTVQMGSDTDLFSKEPSEFKKNFPYKLIHQGVSAEMMGEKYGITRAECDAFAASSHEKAAAAIAAGYFDTQIVSLDAGGVKFNKDEGVRVPVNMEKLGSLKTIFKPEGGMVTAGNASQVSDGAAAVVVASEKAVSEFGLKKQARVVARVACGSDPVIMLDGVIPATQKVLAKAGLTMNDIDLFEVNEAFAVVVLSWMKQVGAPADRVNVNGGAIAHGHPLGASGAVLMTKLVNELKRSGKRYGLQTMCIGHGMATATIVENLA